MTGEQFIHLGAGVGFAAGIVLGAAQDYIIGRAMYRRWRWWWPRKVAIPGMNQWVEYLLVAVLIVFGATVAYWEMPLYP